jgi:hypothetical protein
MRGDKSQPSGVPEQLNPIPSTYPIASRFASAATPKLCGKPGGILSLVPYPDHKYGIRTEFQHLCLAHASQVAAWRFSNSDTSVSPLEHDV